MASGETCLFYSLHMSFAFVYSQYFYTSVVDLVSREDEDSTTDEDDCKMPAVETSPKRKQSVP